MYSQRPGTATDINTIGIGFGGSTLGEGWTDANGGFGTHLGSVEQNLNSGLMMRYTDPDGILRRASAGLVSSPTPSSTVGLPLATPASASSRPIILHRPFRSVAELGYVFSDTPWRNIDFFTPESGYAPLLDCFCINEDNRADAVEAGRVDLNGRQSPVFRSLIAGAYRDELTPGTGNLLLTSEAASAAQALVARTTNTSLTNEGPLANISELVGRYVAGYTNSNGSPYDGFSNDLSYTGGTSSANNLVQRFRESAMRALSDSGQAGTWNLLIDVVAQSGRYPASATNFSNFVVEGERHYWVHVSIDRQTDKVIDENIESVNPPQ